MSVINSEKSFIESLTLGVVKTLERRQGICDIKLDEKPPAEKHHLQSWEQRFSCLMPEDLKGFYMSINGMKLTWSVKLNDVRVPVGCLEINSLSGLNRIGGVNPNNGDKNFPSLLDIDLDSGDADTETLKPKFDHRSRIFELDPCDGCGKVCLVYNNTKPGVPAQKAEVWFLDRALQWHFLADSFLSYFRLAVTHMGLPQWQYKFTDIGLSPQAQQWFNLYTPGRLAGQEISLPDHEEITDSTTTSNTLDTARVFKGRNDKKKTQPAQITKKKPPGGPSRSAPIINKTTGSAGSSSKSIR